MKKSSAEGRRQISRQLIPYLEIVHQLLSPLLDTMSLLFASSSTASRHIRHQLLSNVPKICNGGNGIAARRSFASKGKGLRRPKNSKPRASSSKATSNKATNNVSSSTAQQQQKPPSLDPHLLANEMVNMSSQGRTPGTEAIAKSLTAEQRWSNFLMAGGLLGFVSYIFYYSLASVGGVENAKALIFGSSGTQEEDGKTPGFEEFLKEANEGRSVEEKRMKAEQDAVGEVRELVVLESSEGEEEIEMVRVAGFEVEGEEGLKQKRPLWKRVVFFWRRE